MTKQEFKALAERQLYQELAVNLNILIGTNKTSAASVGLFLNLHIEVEVRKLSNSVKVSKKLDKIHECVSTNLSKHKQDKVTFTFYYSEDKDLVKLSKLIIKKKANYYFAYLYARELMRITLNHTTKVHFEMMRSSIKKVDKSLQLFYINAASHFKVNKYINSLFINSRLTDEATDIFKHQFFNPRFDDMTDIEILKTIVKEDMNIVKEPNGVEDLFLIDNIPFTAYEVVNDTLDDHITDLAESIKNTFKNYSRGTSSATIFDELFVEQKVKTGWLKKLTAKFQREVFHKTADFSCSWAGVSSTYRHIFKSPKKKFQSTSIELVISVDQSGSMNNEELGKLTYLVRKQGKAISKITVILHDTEVIETFVLESNTDISEDPEFINALGTRYSSGGTSHYHVFALIDSLNLDYDKSIYISFSDNCSDIPNSLSKFPALKQLETIWLDSSGDNPIPSSCGGTNIALI